MSRLRAIARAAGPSLLDVHADADHHRSVFTLAGPGGRDASTGARSLAAAVAEQCSIVDHVGEHPRFGALDVVPFVALGGTRVERAQAAEEARTFGAWWAREFGVPVFLYDDADPEHRDLPSARLDELSQQAPGLRPRRSPPTPRCNGRGRACPPGGDQLRARDSRRRRRPSCSAATCASAGAASGACAPSASSCPRPSARRCR